MVITKAAVTVKFPEVLKDPFNIVHGSGAVAVSDHLHFFPRCLFVVVAQFLADPIQVMFQMHMMSEAMILPVGRMGVQ